MLFGLHIYNVKQDPAYRKLNTHQKIDQCYQYLHIFARALNIFYSSHHILKHFSVVHPNPYVLLWIIPETRGFSTVLSFSMIHPYAGLVVACTCPLTIIQAAFIYWQLQH